MTQQLLSPVQVGRTTLANRVVMAPLTRSRAGQPGDVPTELNVTYYAQRATAGLIVTEGFRDLLEIGRQKRPDLYDMQADKPPTLVSRDLRLEVPERMRHDGSDSSVPISINSLATSSSLA